MLFFTYSERGFLICIGSVPIIVGFLEPDPFDLKPVFRIRISLADPDPGFYLNVDPDMNTDPDSGSCYKDSVPKNK